MPYYPKSQIKTNLFSKPGELIIQSTQQEYIGFYYEISSGEKYTGKYPGDGQNQLLINPFNPSLDLPLPPRSETTPPSPLYLPLDLLNSAIYGSEEEVPNFLKNSNINVKSYPQYQNFIPRGIPNHNLILPTPQDYTTGIFTRYFAKKNNEPKFIEINLDQYNKFLKKDPTVALDLYSVGKILWKIKGTSNQVYEANKKNTELFENQNKWWGFSQYFKDNFTRYLK